MRQVCSLAGSWEFQLDPRGVFTVDSLAPDREITVPLPWQAAFPELQPYSGYAWYRRSVDIPADWLRGEVLLRFGAVDYWCQVFINGQAAGEHEGGYTPFTLSIGRFLRPGRNEIAVRVYDVVQEELVVPRWPEQAQQQGEPLAPYAATDIPHGKQEWYINVGGIWQDVTLTTVPRSYIDYVQVRTDPATGAALVALELAGEDAACAGSQLAITIEDREGRSWSTSGQLLIGQSRYEARVEVEQPRLWSCEDPYLYTATVTLTSRDIEDRTSVRFGFREIATRDGQLLLNGQPIFLLAALDQAFYPDTIYTVPSEAFLRDQFQKAKQLGLNCLRCHIKPPDPLYLELADEMGLLIWSELPSWRTFYTRNTIHSGLLDLDEQVKRRAERTLEEMVRRDFNHPALVIWTIVNEDWGTSLPLSAADREWVGHMYQRCKELDPTRLVVDNSPCPHAWGPNIHIQSDLDDFHIYANIPDQATHFEHTIEQLALRPLWTFSAHGDARRTGQEPLILSEFGNWGLPSLAALRGADGRNPDWFALGPWWSAWDGEAGWPLHVEQRFMDLGLDVIWGDYENFARATQWHQFAALKFEIETMRRQPTLAGYVITELSDIYWESNGLLDFARNPKAYHDRFASINAPDVIVPQLRRYSAWDDQQLAVWLHVARYGTTPWDGARLSWDYEGGEGGEMDVAELTPGSVRALGCRVWTMPKRGRTQPLRVELTLRNGRDVELARNYVDLLLLPAEAREVRYQSPIAMILVNERLQPVNETMAVAPEGPESDIVPGVAEEQALLDELERERRAPAFKAAVRHLGYHIVDRPNADTQLAVSNYPDAELLRWVREGGSLLFLCKGPSPFFWVQGRGGTYGGAWMTSFSWLRPGVHRRLEVDNPLGLPFMHCMPRGTILGLPLTDPEVQPDLLAGMVVGWAGHPAIHTVQFRYGAGRVVMTTFALEDAIGRRDPVGVAMFHDLVEHLASDACRPTLTANF